MFRIVSQKNILKREFSCTKYLLNQTQTVQNTETKPRGRLFFVKLKKSKNHQTEAIKKICSTLKLKKIHQIQVYRDTPTIRGLIYKARHLFEVHSVSTAALFPNGTENFGYTFSSKPEIKRGLAHKGKERKLKRLQRFKKMLTHKFALKYPKLRKRPSRTHLK